MTQYLKSNLSTTRGVVQAMRRVRRGGPAGPRGGGLSGPRRQSGAGKSGTVRSKSGVSVFFFFFYYYLNPGIVFSLLFVPFLVSMSLSL